MKKKLFILLLLVGLSKHTETQLPRDIPQEVESLDQIRLRQQLSDFYYNCKQILKEIHVRLFGSNLSSYIFPEHPYSHQNAVARLAITDELAIEEKLFRQTRTLKIKNALENIFNITLRTDAIPKIGFCFSGGGFRAMIMTFGFLAAAEQTGLLDSSLYIAGLSGSTWAVAPWIASGLPVREVQKRMAINASYGIEYLSDKEDLDYLISVIKTKLLYDQVISVVDIYGHLLAKTLFSGLIGNLKTTLTESHKRVVEGNHPLPIYTTIQTKALPYEWLEVTPFEIGSSYLKGYVPTWAFGRNFKYGVSQNFAPEQTLGFFLGIFGSAFEVSLKDVISMSAQNLVKMSADVPDFLFKPLKEAIQLIVNSCIGDLRLFPAMLANYMYLVEQSPEEHLKTLECVDAGIDFNLPLVPLIRPARNLDLIIVYDCSASVKGAPELVRAQKYAARKGLKFPTIDYEDIDKKLISVFKENDPAVPVVIYIPRIKNNNFSTTFDPDECVEDDFCNTFNFQYAPLQYKLLSEYAESSLLDNEKIIKNVIKAILIQKYKYEL